MLDSLPISALKSALDGLSARERAISDDVANVNTPNYRARSVEFESGLRKALDDGTDPAEAQPTITFSDAYGGPDNNNVDLNAETVLGVQTQLRYELALRATGDRFSLVRTAIKGA